MVNYLIQESIKYVDKIAILFQGVVILGVDPNIKVHKLNILLRLLWVI